MPEPLLKAVDVERTYKVGRGRVVHAVQSVSLDVGLGETVGLVGESGCGKSTLGRVLIGLDAADSGEISFSGEPISVHTPARVRREIQIIFQDPLGALNPRMTAGAAIAEVLRAHRLVSREKIEAAVQDLLERVGLRGEMADRKPYELSGGERQRVVIARALATNPRMIIADEAVSALDVSIQAQILNLLARLQDELGLSYLFVSHDLGVVRHVSARIYVMYLGRIVESGPTDLIFDSPRHPYTAALLASVPNVNDFGIGDTDSVRGDVPDPMNPPSGCPFHPRCQFAADRCRVELPQLTSAGAGAQFACHYPLEPSRVGVGASR